MFRPVFPRGLAAVTCENSLAPPAGTSSERIMRGCINLAGTAILRAVNRHSNLTRGAGYYIVRTPRIKLTASGARNIAKPGFPFAFSVLWAD
jgi:hypothetical protein